MSRIHNLESLLLEKQRLHYECKLKEEKIKYRLEHFKEEVPGLVKQLIPSEGGNLMGILKTVGGVLLKSAVSGPASSLGTSVAVGAAEMVLAKTLFKAASKIFSKKKKPAENKEPEKPAS